MRTHLTRKPKHQCHCKETFTNWRLPTFIYREVHCFYPRASSFLPTVEEKCVEEVVLETDDDLVAFESVITDELREYAPSASRVLSVYSLLVNHSVIKALRGVCPTPTLEAG